MDFEQFAREQLPALVRFTTAMCAERGLAEDVVQDVLIRVHEQWPRISRLDSPEGYVRRALVNEYLSWRRKWARVVPHAVVPSGGRDTPDPAEQHANRSALAGELAALPARQRAVLVMRFYGGFTDEEIAAALGCRAVTVRGYVSRGLAALRIEMSEPIRTRTGSDHAH